MKNVLLNVALFCAVLLAFSSCEKSDNNSETSVNKWIETNMRHWYYWHDDIPSSSSLNHSATPENFFKSLLSLKDGKDKLSGHNYYSAIKKKSSTTRRAEGLLGFEYQKWYFTNSNAYMLNVLYVLPNSPAEAAGLKRGEWIFKVNEQAITSANTFADTDVVELTVGDKFNTLSTQMRTMTLAPSVVEDNPILLTDVFQDSSTQMKKVGYMVYNHFTSGPSGDGDNTYNQQLVSEFAKFKTAGVEEFVLDLRYNGGGLLTCSQLLSQLLAPKAALGKIFCETRYNTNNAAKDSIYYLQQNSENLNLNRLFVLTSSRTASASEAVIYCLQPYFDVVLIGETTEGKNVGSSTLSNDKYDYELHPIVCKIYNAKGVSDYENGIVPNYMLTGDARMVNGAIELGDRENDIPLRVALQMMTTNSMNNSTRNVSNDASDATPLFNSLTQKQFADLVSMP